MSIVAQLAGQFGSQSIGSIAGSLGMATEKAQASMDAAIPALLGALAALTSKPEGAQVLANALRQADVSYLDKLTGSAQGDDRQSLVDAGTNMLGALFGDKSSTLVSSLASETGLPSGFAKSLLGLATPAVMGLLKKEQQSRGLNLPGLVAMLQDQKELYGSSLPHGVSSQPSSAGLIEGLSEPVVDATRPAAITARRETMETTRAAQSVSHTAPTRTQSVPHASGSAVAPAKTRPPEVEARSSSSVWRWLIPLLFLASAAWAAWHFLLAPKPERVAVRAPETREAPTAAPATRVEPEPATKQAQPEPTTQVKPEPPAATQVPSPGAVEPPARQDLPAAPPSLVLNGVDLGQSLSDAMNTVGWTLSGIKDAAGAKAALAQLNAQAKGISDIARMADKLPSADRQALSQQMGPLFTKLESLARQLLNVPGIGPILAPVVTPILAQLSVILTP
jgi:hypothetical protein